MLLFCVIDNNSHVHYSLNSSDYNANLLDIFPYPRNFEWQVLGQFLFILSGQNRQKKIFSFYALISRAMRIDNSKINLNIIDSR